MTLLAPWFLLLGLAPLALAAAYVIGQRRRREYAVRFTSVDLLASVAPRQPGWRRPVSAGFVLAAAAAMVVALARPAVTDRVPRDRGTVLLAIDT
ncbi:MAG: BatA domain-containing protein, partial [Actinomycetota bacterium]